MKFVILTGMSGAGKSTALKMMEDIGFYCGDNLPIPLLEKFVELSDLQQNVPFISAHALKENTGTDCGEEEAEALLKNYKKLLYNDLFDTKHRLQAFYSYE